MESKQDLLNEYCEITRELEKIRNKVAVLRDFTGEQMTNAKSEKEKDIIFLRFKKELKKENALLSIANVSSSRLTG